MSAHRSVLALALALPAGCTVPAGRAAHEPPAAGLDVELAPTRGAARLGRVAWVGPVPEAAEPSGEWVDRIRSEWPDADVSDRSLCVDESGGLAGAVVALGGASAPSREPRAHALVHRRHQLEPRVQVARPGDVLALGRADEAVHNSRVLMGKACLANVIVERGATHAVALDRPGLVEVRCDLHPWTVAWVVVLADGERGAVTAADGAFRVAAGGGAPPTSVRVWHERIGAWEAPLPGPLGAGRVRVEHRVTAAAGDPHPANEEC